MDVIRFTQWHGVLLFVFGGFIVAMAVHAARAWRKADWADCAFTAIIGLSALVVTSIFLACGP
jgi:hypothetical protein